MPFPLRVELWDETLGFEWYSLFNFLGVYNVRDFGAEGNGNHDDTAAIQAAVDRASSAGGGTVFFPPGVYRVKINPSSAVAVSLRKNVFLLGTSPADSVIKLADDQGEYLGIFLDNGSLDTGYVGAIKLGFNSNNTNNPVTDVSILPTRPRMAFWSQRCHRAMIQDCHFTDHDGFVVTYLRNYNQTSGDFAILNCRYDQIGESAEVHDLSCINVNGVNTRSLIKGNFLVSAGVGSMGARTGIEAHGIYAIEDNYIEGFARGIASAATYPAKSTGIISQNIIRKASYGINIYCDGDHVGPGIDQLIIANNQIELDADGWNRIHESGVALVEGISFSSGTIQKEVRGLSIINNQINCKATTVPGNLQDTRAAGINLTNISVPGNNENIILRDNLIQNMPAGGIRIDSNIRNMIIDGNTIINPGQIGSAIGTIYRSGMYIVNDLENVIISNNVMIDDQATSTIQNGLYFGTSTELRCEAFNNRLIVADGSVVSLYAGTSLGDWTTS